MKLRSRWGGSSKNALAMVLILASAAGADTFTVTRNDDPVPDGCLPADCSLREAVIDANANGLADTITLPAGTYTLAIPGDNESAAATGDLDVTEELTIDGAGARSTIIDGGFLDRVFELWFSAGTVEITDLTIRNGLRTGGSGGAILDRGVTFLMSGCTVAGNTAAGLGGGILGVGTVLIIESTVKDNVGGRGGGLSQADGGTLTVINSTISGNMAIDFGGGISSSGSGTVVDLRNVTVTGNVADADDDGFGNGGGLFASNSGVVQIGHTIVSNNLDLGGESPDCAISFNQFPSTGYNLIGDSSGGCSPSGDDTGNLYNIDPLLSPLASNGGPTDTHALQPGSPAIDAGNPAGCLDENDVPLTADQRGEPRPSDGNGDTVAVCDMGAYEVGPLVFGDGFESADTSAWSTSVP